MPVFPPLIGPEISLAHMLNTSDDLDDSVVPVEFRNDFTGKSLKSLRKGQWLTDEVVNAYLRLIQNAFPRVFVFNSFFWQKLTQSGRGYDYAGVANWARKKKTSLFDSSIALIPLHVQGTHWALAVIDFRDNSIGYYDSIKDNPFPDSFKSALTRYLADQAKSESRPLRKWKVHKPDGLPQQANENDCGVFMSLTAVYLANDQPPQQATRRERVEMRRRMLVQLCKGCL